ncbi:MAG: geranylgeranyl reductase family protein [Promethearchaeota archaeon]
MNYDCIIVGAGTGGTIASRTLAMKDYNVILIDRKKKEDIGNKVCGDAIGKHHFDSLNRLIGLRYPTKEECEANIDGIDVISPDKETILKIRGEGYMINRIKFGQRLLEAAIATGVEFLDTTSVISPLYKGKFVRGVLTRSLDSGTKKEIHGHVVIDASGVTTIIRRKIQNNKVEKHVHNEDTILCFREIRKLAREIEDPNFCKIYLTQSIAPGGYVWIFPKGKTTANVGLCVQNVTNNPHPRRQLYEHVLSAPLFGRSEIIHKGGGIVPTRRPIWSQVENGLLIVGDAACQVNPLHGGGIGPSMIGGYLAATTVDLALENGDATERGLWDYNINYMKDYGAKQAGLDLFRLFLQHTADKELNYGMRHHLLKEEDILLASLGEDLVIDLTEKEKRLFKGIRKLELLNRLQKISTKMKEIKQLFQNYPDPERFEAWKAEVETIYKDTWNILGAILPYSSST